MVKIRNSSSSIGRVANEFSIHPASFRDPAGFVLTNGREIRRVVTRHYEEQYEYFVESGLCKELVGQGLIMPFEEVADEHDYVDAQYKVLESETVPFISYPSEWSFQQLKEAALVTLDIQLQAMEYGMLLKDASCFNIQMFRGRMIHIDTLSFEFYDGQTPWIAYRQFCEHFLAPLLLYKYCDTRLSKLMGNSVAGLPLDLAVKLLPVSVLLKPAIFSNVWLHSKTQILYADREQAQEAKLNKVSRTQLSALLNQLRTLIKKLQPPRLQTEWANYYSDNNYSATALQAKIALVKDQVKLHRPEAVLELGGNNGFFSRLISDECNTIVCADIDHDAVQSNFSINRTENIDNIIPLVVDFAEPTPALGLELTERDSFLDRSDFDMVIALAVVHHLVISSNIPMERLANLLGCMGKKLLIEFVPDDDEQIKKITVSRPIDPNLYSLAIFEKAFSQVFCIKKKMKIINSSRTLYYMEK